VAPYVGGNDLSSIIALAGRRAAALIIVFRIILANSRRRQLKPSSLVRWQSFGASKHHRRWRPLVRGVASIDMNKTPASALIINCRHNGMVAASSAWRRLSSSGVQQSFLSVAAVRRDSIFDAVATIKRRTANGWALGVATKIVGGDGVASSDNKRRRWRYRARRSRSRGGAAKHQWRRRERSGDVEPC